MRRARNVSCAANDRRNEDSAKRAWGDPNSPTAANFVRKTRTAYKTRYQGEGSRCAFEKIMFLNGKKIWRQTGERFLNVYNLNILTTARMWDKIKQIAEIAQLVFTARAQIADFEYRNVLRRAFKIVAELDVTILTSSFF